MRVSWLVATTLCVATSAAASPIIFDCDVPADRFSSVSSTGDGIFRVGGEVKPVEKRSGKYLPLAGVRIESEDGKTSIGFRLVAAQPKASILDVVVNQARNGEQLSGKIGAVSADDTTHFQIDMSVDGKLAIKVGDVAFADNLPAIRTAKITVFCSTGQFKFSDLRMGSEEPSTKPAEVDQSEQAPASSGQTPPTS